MDPKPEPPACHLCGREAVMEIDGEGWCEGCLHARGSCCSESEMDEDERRCALEHCDLEG